MRKYFKKSVIFLIIAVMIIPALILIACNPIPPVKTVESIAMEGTPSKTQYFINEDLDVTGFKIRVIYSDGTYEILDVKKDWITGYSSTSVGTKTLTITYKIDGKEFITTTSVTVKASVPAKTVKSIAMEVTPYKTEYFVDEELDLTGFKIKVTYGDDTFEILDVEGDWVTGFDTATDGIKTLIITYGEETCEIAITVNKIPPKPVKVENGNYAFDSIKLGDIKIDFTNSDTQDASIAEFFLKTDLELRRELVANEVAAILADNLESEFGDLFGSDRGEFVKVITECFAGLGFDFEAEGNFDRIAEELAIRLLNKFRFKLEYALGIQKFLEDFNIIENYNDNIIAIVIGMFAGELSEEYKSLDFIIDFLKTNIFIKDNDVRVGEIKTTYTTDEFGIITLDLDGIMLDEIVVAELLEGVSIKYENDKIVLSLSMAEGDLEFDLYAVYKIAPITELYNLNYQLKTRFIGETKLVFENSEIESYASELLIVMGISEPTSEQKQALVDRIKFFDFKILFFQEGLSIKSGESMRLSGTFVMDESGNIEFNLTTGEQDYIKLFNGISVVYDPLEDEVKITEKFEIGGKQFSIIAIYNHKVIIE